jgi:hypothetical protein
MSFIRASSNPEGLYIFGSGEDRLEFSWFEDGRRLNTVGSLKDFQKLCDTYINDGQDIVGDRIEVGDYALYEEQKDEESPFKLTLLINGVRLSMWPITWYYLINGRVEERRRKKLLFKILNCHVRI